MTDRETIAHLRHYVQDAHDSFSWPTDACGYWQHIRFVKYRNKYWHGEAKDFPAFVLDYAQKLEQGDSLR